MTQSPPPNARVICLANVCCRAPSLTVTEQTESKEERESCCCTVYGLRVGSLVAALVNLSLSSLSLSLSLPHPSRVFWTRQPDTCAECLVRSLITSFCAECLVTEEMCGLPPPPPLASSAWSVVRSLSVCVIPVHSLQHIFLFSYPRSFAPSLLVSIGVMTIFTLN